MIIICIGNYRLPTEKAHGYQISKMCECFAEKGADVELVFPTRKNEIKEDLFDYYDVKRNFSAKIIKSFDFLTFAKKLGSLSFYLQAFTFYFKTIFIKFDKSAIIFTRNPEIVWIFKKRGFKVVYECHDWFGKKKNISLRLLKDVDFIITTNNYIKNNFLKNGFNEKKLHTIPNGVEVEKFSINISKEEAIQRLPFDDSLKKLLQSSKVLLYTGSYKTMGVEKGIDEILEALKELDDTYIFLAIGGSDKDIKYYSEKAREINVQDKVILKGRYNHNELALMQKASDVLLMPFPDKAHYKYHMTPLKMFEYMCAGRPIIASDLPSIREILNNRNCLFCKPDDPISLVEKIEQVFRDTKKAKSLSNQALEDIKKYDWMNRAGKILDFIDF